MQTTTLSVKQSAHTITDIAFAVGFQDLRTFERSFKKSTARTPRSFKASVRPSREHGDPQIHLFFAERYFGEEQWTRSEARFRKVAELAPETSTFTVSFTHIRLGQICDLTDRRSEAKGHYRRARDTAGPYKRAAEHFLENRYSRG